MQLPSGFLLLSIFAIVLCNTRLAIGKIIPLIPKTQESDIYLDSAQTNFQIFSPASDRDTINIFFYKHRVDHR